MKYFPLLLLLVVSGFTGCRETPKEVPESQELEQRRPQDTKEKDTEPGMANTPEASEEVMEPQDAVYSRYGRTAMRENGSVELISPASAIRFQVKGDTVTIALETAKDVHAYALITLDNTFSWKYRLPSSGVNTIPVALGDKEAWHEIEIHKLTEAHTGGILFHGADGAEMRKTGYDPELQIEFIGNSITCGYGADQRDVPCGTDVNWDQHNAYESYASRLARDLGAAYNLSAISGIGVYRNYGDETSLTMPELYDNLYLDGGDTAAWVPNAWNPDIVSICLGTNDMSEGGEGDRAPFDVEKFRAAYIEFINGLQQRYPDAAFALLTSPMLSGEKSETLYEVLKQVTGHFEGQHIAVYQFTATYTSGCATHPSLSEQEAMADAVRPFFIKLLDQVAMEGEAGP